MLELKWFIGENGIEDAYAIRHEVFVKEQGIAEDDEFDGTDSSCTHLVIYEHNKPIATGRIMIEHDHYKIGRVAVLKPHRGRQLGVGIMQAIIDACCQMGDERQTLNAQVSAMGFYEKLGFTPYGEQFDEAGIPHIAMEHYGPIKCCGH